ncbi:methyl farnesoate epoxidase-like isoform X2 [Planococcus citri]|uniref:methyl farnesoate epoxidase-like isoform X2 n=1 Tax=Planococcus citri TaxID=170843 RepID=UPI0031F9A5AF
MVVCFALVILLIICVLAFANQKPKNYPPGPSWLPFLGCFLQIRNIHAKKPYYHLVWAQMQQMYGPVVGLKLGMNKVIVVSGYEAVQQAMFKTDFQGRPDGFCFRLRTMGQRLGLVFVDGSFMKEQRRFCLSQLRLFGWDKTQMNDIVVKEGAELVNLIKNECQRGPIQAEHLFDVSTLNTIWTMIASTRFSLDDEKLIKLVYLVHEVFRILDMSGGPLNQMPFIRYVAPKKSGYASMVAITAELVDFLKEVVREHQESQADSFINTFLQEVNNNKSNKDSTFTENQLLAILMDFFMAGTETTSNTLSFMIHYLVKYPQVQEKIHAEIDRALNPQQIPTMEDKDKLVYLEATIMEVQRHGSPVPITVPHKTIQDTKLMNYSIPKDTIVLPNIWSVHMDEDYWKDPHVFRPERFIDSKGKRRCIGEILAKTTLFIFISAILQSFKVESNSDTDFTAKLIDGITLALVPFQVKFIPRK